MIIKASPNPLARQYVFEQTITDGVGKEFIEQSSCILANKILSINAITRVFFGSHFVTVYKQEEYIWEDLDAIIIDILQEHFKDKNNTTVEDSDIYENIYNTIENMIKPSLATHGGSIELIEFQDGKVYVKLFGACSGCPSASLTMKHGVERLLKLYIPQVNEVISV